MFNVYPVHSGSSVDIDLMDREDYLNYEKGEAYSYYKDYRGQNVLDNDFSGGVVANNEYIIIVAPNGRANSPVQVHIQSKFVPASK